MSPIRASLCDTHAQSHRARQQAGKTRFAGVWVALVALLAGPASLTALAADGELDVEFGVGGLVSIDLEGYNDDGQALAVDGVGRIYLAGSRNIHGQGDQDFVVARLLPDGERDMQFGTDGWVGLDLSGTGSSEQVTSIALQSDGKILLAGTSNRQGSFDFTLVRLLPDGSPDSRFGTQGMVATDFGGGEAVYSLHVAPDGRILAAGFSSTGGYDIAVAGYLPDGTLDPSFGSGGRLSLDFSGGSFDQAYSMALQANGRILLAGVSDSAGDYDFAVVRLLANGTLDASYGQGGRVLVSDPGLQVLYRLTLDHAGRALAIGASDLAETIDFAVLRFDTDGNPDTGFGDAGQTLIDIDSGTDFPRDIVVACGDRIVLVGQTDSRDNHDMVLVRLTPEGELDPGFAGGGVVRTDWSNKGSSSDYGRAVLALDDGKLLVAGTSDAANGINDLAVARYHGCGPTFFNGFEASTTSRNADAP